MADSKDDNSFWKNTNDDFWNKPIMPNDWKREETGKEEQTILTENPFVESHHHDDPDPDKNHLPKKKHIHTIICLIFMALAVFSVAGAVIGIKIVKKQVLNLAGRVSWGEEEVTDTFLFDENNTVVLEDQAYTIVTEDNFAGLREGEKLVGIYLEVYSDKYRFESDVCRDIYIGYESAGERYYKQGLNEEAAYSYVRTCNFRWDQLLNDYGAGNGVNSAGFYFFIVPSETEKVTLYIEKRNRNKSAPIIEKVFFKELEVLPWDEEINRKLSERDQTDL